MSQIAPRTIPELIAAQQPAIAMAVGGKNPEERRRRAERFVRICLTAVRKDPKLMQCTQQSFAAALMICAQLDLEPNTPQGLAYLIPYRNNKSGVIEAQFQIGYKGLLQLAYRSGMVQSFNADVVYRAEVEAGLFEYHKGICPSIRHDSDLLNAELRKGEIVAAYAACTLIGGQPLLRVIDRQDVVNAKKASASARYSSSPWVTHEASMWMKTAIKRLAAWMPQTEMLALAVDSDDRSERGETVENPTDENTPKAGALDNLNNALKNAALDTSASSASSDSEIIEVAANEEPASEVQAKGVPVPKTHVAHPKNQHQGAEIIRGEQLPLDL